MSKWQWSSSSPKLIFLGLHYPLTWSNMFSNGRGKRGALLKKGKGPWQRNVVMMNFWWILWGMRRRRQEKTREWSILILFFKQPFWANILKKSSHSFFGAWSFFFVHIWITPSEGPKDFANCFYFEKPDHEKRPSTKIHLHGSWCKPALSYNSS